jgi:hypothetical protein
LRLNKHPFSSKISLSEAVRRRLPTFAGRAVQVRFLPSLSAGRRKLYSNRPAGQPVYAATFIRQRKMVLDRELKRKPRELVRILIHELFHFAWVRLGNKKRREYETLLRQEWKRHARGELGWSAQSRKLALPRNLPATHNLSGWREYVCESFCDTAAWLYSRLRDHREFTLAERHRKRRAQWFRETFQGRGIPI